MIFSKKFILKFLLILLFTGVFMNKNFADTFFVSSTSFKNNETLKNEQVYNGYGCSGDNISPDLKWTNAPKDTKSFAIVAHDPDAPVENGWYHWIIINIPKDKIEIKKGERIISPAKELITSFDTKGYGGACPPVGHGTHHYNFNVYALNVERIDIPDNISPKEAHDMIKNKSIAKAAITALYQR